MKQLWGCIKINFTHLRRRKVIVTLVVLAVLISLVLGYFVMPFFSFYSTSPTELIPQFKDTVPEVYGFVLKFLLVITAVIGLVCLSDSLEERSLKMIITRPCPIETWVASHFILGLGIIFLGMSALTFSIQCLFYAYELPFSTYWWIVTFDHFMTAVSLFSFLALLSLFVRPVIGAMLAGVLNANLFEYLLQGIKQLPYQEMESVTYIIANFIHYLILILYTLTPYYFPFDRSEINVFTIWEQPLETTGEWDLILWHGGYSFLLMFVCYCLICLFLHYRNKA